MTSDKLFINETCDPTGVADKASAISSPLSTTSSEELGAKHTIPDCEYPCCSANPLPTGISDAALKTANLLVINEEEVDNILHAEGDNGEEIPENPLDDIK